MAPTEYLSAPLQVRPSDMIVCLPRGRRQEKVLLLGGEGCFGGGSRLDHNFRPKRYKFFYAFIRFRTFQNVKIHTQKNLFGCTTPQKTCTFDHNWGRGGGVAILWWAPPKSTSFFLTSPLTLSAWPKNLSFTEGCLKHIFHLKFLLQIEQKDNFPFNEMDYHHGNI